MRRYFYLSSLIAAVLLASPPLWGSEVSTWDTSADGNNKASPDGWTTGTMLPNQVEPTAREMMAAIARWYQNGRTGSFPSSFGATPTSEVIFNFGSFPVAGEIPAGVLQAYDCGMVVPVSYTQAAWPNTCFAAYIDNQNAANTNSAVGFFSSGWADAPGTGTTGNSVLLYNGVLSNTDPANGYGAGTAANKGKDFGEMVGIEPDFNIWKKAAGVTPGGKLTGFRAIGGGEVVPSGGAFAYQVYPLGTGLPWTDAFVSEIGGATTGLYLKAVAPFVATAQPSQGIQLDVLDVTGTPRSATMQAVPDGGTADLDLGVPGSGLVRVLNASVVQYSFSNFGIIGTNTAVAPAATGPFIYINAITAGAPSGVPTFASDGRVPLVVDLTNHKLCWYEHTPAAWKCATGS